MNRCHAITPSTLLKNVAVTCSLYSSTARRYPDLKELEPSAWLLRKTPEGKIGFLPVESLSEEERRFYRSAVSDYKFGVTKKIGF